MKEPPQDNTVRRALAVIDPLPTERESCRKLVQTALEILEFIASDQGDDLALGVNTSKDKAALARYVTALRKVQVCHAALNPEVQSLLALKASTIEADIVDVAEFLTLLSRLRPRPSKRPPNKGAPRAVSAARFVLEQRRCELTTERRGKWHLLSQVFANTSRDLRHHLTAALTRKPRPEPPTLQEILAAVNWRKTQKNSSLIRYCVFQNAETGHLRQRGRRRCNDTTSATRCR
jgi:hypothetical protein